MNSLIFVFLLVLFANGGVLGGGRESEEAISFDQNYEVLWGGSYVVPLNQGKEIQLTMDSSSGSGFGSKMKYGSGFFHLRIKVPGGDSAGVVTAYYLISGGNRRDELDFEFLGNREGKPYTLQTNVYADGKGDREQRLQLWFDPTQEFHDYRILLNQHQIVFFVDNIPIRVYKNKINIGAGYPSKPMQIQATLWDGSNWATDGGNSKVNWSFAPFKANFQGFDVRGCQAQQDNDDGSYNNIHQQDCASEKYSWNGNKFWQLDPVKQRQYEIVKQKFMYYDYCNDKQRFSTPPLECVK